MTSYRTMHRIGVLLAAGRGRRMGRTKQLLSWRSAGGDMPLTAAAYDAIHPICDAMVVVVGHEADAVVAALGERRFHRVDSDADAPMFESMRAGLAAAAAIDPSAVVVLQPGDHPKVAPDTLVELTNQALLHPLRAIIPTYGGRGGHPVLIPPCVAAVLVHADAPAGLGEFWRTHANLCIRIEVNDPTIVRDVDTPRDLPI